MKNDKLNIYLYGKKIGLLEKDTKGKLLFIYECASSCALSLSLPVTKNKSASSFYSTSTATAITTTYDDHQCDPYFSGLIPDNAAILNPLSTLLKTQPSDVFGILQALGFDCAGAVQFDPLELPAFKPEEPIKILTQNEIEKQVKNMTKTPFFLTDEGGAALISGKQPKVGIRYFDDHIALVSKPHLSTHILKPALGKSEILQNEWFCMTLAQKIGLPTAQVALRQWGKVLALVIKRYDRFIENDKVGVIHQEDFCQALGLLCQSKFQRNKGVSLKDCFDLLSKTTFPARSRIQLMDVVIFNYLINNTNAHGKKFSLLINEHGVISLAPLYGVQCGYFSNQSSKAAMKLGHQYETSAVTIEDWHILCKDIGYAYPALRKRLQEMAELMLMALPKIRWDSQDANLDDGLMDKLEQNIAKQCESALKLFLLD